MVSKAWKNKIGKIFLIVVLLFITPLLFTGQLYAYSLGVHKKITKRTINQNVDKLNKSINDYTGLANGLNEFISDGYGE